MKRFVVIGLGNFGASVAQTLHEIGHEVATLDRDAERVDAMARIATKSAVGDGTDVRTLKRVGAEGADAAIISTGDDITASALTALMLRDLGVRELYVKVISSDHARLIEKIGVTETIFPERESGVRLGKRISSQLVLNYVPLGPDFSLQEMAVPESWVARSLRQLQLPRRHGISVVAVHDMLSDSVQPVPDPDAPLKESDTLIVAGTEASLSRTAKLR